MQLIGVQSALDAILSEISDNLRGSSSSSSSGRERVGETEIEKDREDLLADVQQ